jgi:hypothetical protein
MTLDPGRAPPILVLLLFVLLLLAAELVAWGLGI